MQSCLVVEYVWIFSLDETYTSAKEGMLFLSVLIKNESDNWTRKIMSNDYVPLITYGYGCIPVMLKPFLFIFKV